MSADEDDAGQPIVTRAERKRVKDAIENREVVVLTVVTTYVARCPAGKRPDDLDDVELWALTADRSCTDCEGDTIEGHGPDPYEALEFLIPILEALL